MLNLGIHSTKEVNIRPKSEGFVAPIIEKSLKEYGKSPYLALKSSVNEGKDIVIARGHDHNFVHVLYLENKLDKILDVEISKFFQNYHFIQKIFFFNIILKINIIFRNCLRSEY